MHAHEHGGLGVLGIGEGGAAEPGAGEAEIGRQDDGHDHPEDDQLHLREAEVAHAERPRQHVMHLERRGRPDEHRSALEEGDEADGDEEAVDEIVAGEAEEGLVGEVAGGGSDEAGGHDRRRVGQAPVLGQRVGRVGPDHHELTEGEVHDAGDAEGERDAERDDAVHGADDRAVQHLAEDELGHGVRL